MTASLVTAPSVEPFDVAEAKRHLRIADDVDEFDTDILALIAAVRSWGEVFTGRSFLPQTWDLKGDCFPSVIVLPKPPVTGVTSITYIDTNGDSQTLSSALYTTDLPSGPYAPPGRIVPAYGQSWPSTRDMPNAVTVRFATGYADPDTVPANIKAALKIRLNTLFEHREAVVVGTIASPVAIGGVPLDEHLLWPFKVWL